MTKLLQQALFIIPLAVVIAAPAVLHLKNNTTKQESSSYATTTSGHIASIFAPKKLSNAVSEKQKYTMPEPFADGYAIGMTYAMRKSMDPKTWMQMMTTMMNPHGTSTEAMCASCHEGEDLARYQNQFGPMMQPSWNQYKAMMDPHAMGAMMNPMMMTQMMHQMAAIPMQMMMPMMMNSGLGMNPHMGIPTTPSATVPKVMDPKQYEEWYNEQQK